MDVRFSRETRPEDDPELTRLLSEDVDRDRVVAEDFAPATGDGLDVLFLG